MILVLVLAMLAPSHPMATSRGTDRPAVTCQQGFAPSHTKVSYPSSPCEPCEEAGTAYPGNNLNAAPNYGVETVSECRQQCRLEIQCRYWTWDKENLWCYLKTDKGQRDIKDERYVSGSDNKLCDSEEDEENEIKDKESEREERKGFSVGHTPIVSVYHKTGYRTVLTALPATFGLQIQNETEVTGLVNDTKSTFCVSPSQKGHLPHSLGIAVVQRGECKFSKKAENAAREGYQGIIILDTKENTKVDRISGVKSLLTDSIPVVFLLHNEALILQDLLKENPNRTATISDSSTFSWFKRPFTTSTTTTTTTTTSTKPSTFSTTTEETISTPAVIFRNFFPFFGSKKPKVFHKSQDINQDAAVLMISEKTERRGIIEVTPLTIGAISVGVVVCILLIISVITLIVSRVRRKSRRRVQATRCQQAIRQFDAMNRNFGKDNTGFALEGNGNSSQAASRPFPKSTYNLLECPVCLEIAWPPKKIFQCREGHIVCDSCKANPQLKNCPMCRTPFSSHLISRNRSLEEVARVLQEEGSVSSFPDSIVIATPTAPPPDVVPDYTEESESQDPVDAVNDTNQLIVEDTNPDAVRILSIDTISAAPLVVNLPPDSN